jgi:sirohydrochlorin cobaltochelatase
MSDTKTGTLLVLSDIGTAWGKSQGHSLAQALESRLKQPVLVCLADGSDGSLTAGIQNLVAAETQRIVLLTAGLLPLATHVHVAQVIRWAWREWPTIQFHVAPPLTWLEWSDWLRTTILDALQSRSVELESSGALLIGEESANALANADLARLAQLILARSTLAQVGHAFLGTIRPTIAEAVETIVQLGIQYLVLVPWLMANDKAWQSEVESALRARNVKIGLLAVSPTLFHPGLVNVLVANYYAALADNRLQPPSDDLIPEGGSTEATRPSQTLRPEDAFELQELEQRVNAMLPPQYRGRYEEVHPQSMGTAALKYDEEGKVAWDQIWTSFCDLALAGGPPHRGTLLEPVTAAEALADMDRYREVVAEIERGIQMVTGLPVVPSQVLGWVGVRCHGEEMAVWMMRAIIVENVMVRREGEVIYLPAGPRFTLKREIKNVVTTVAKTVHYWTAHLTARQNAAQ